MASQIKTDNQSASTACSHCGTEINAPGRGALLRHILQCSDAEATMRGSSEFPSAKQDPCRSSARSIFPLEAKLMEPQEEFVRGCVTPSLSVRRAATQSTNRKAKAFTMAPKSQRQVPNPINNEFEFEPRSKKSQRMQQLHKLFKVFGLGKFKDILPKSLGCGPLKSLSTETSDDNLPFGIESIPRTIAAPRLPRRGPKSDFRAETKPPRPAAAS
eukprot:c39105_g1_i1.p1 GENE.c39105_g1_i1~~c39105_g1_i1.p1  ORF type:complete len:224 (+),score=25.30 c39105_g1_i1:29-673(+)